ncbi:hypothetical protein LHJ74_18895 [Streptomyces sp. N2-109]|uniref:Integral membrane protein n=1 Tax=Streptomyces gossypii TaxID=2883101 RepID=A0ABT2JVK4_9ACTN|nr:hypothetical protein [Streptomyces gossypii]MCT2591942.1 hypothetical protein [Streptomyces gossypii]
MGQEQTLARGARVGGAVGLLILAFISLGWIIRDFTEAAEVTDVWWMWAGMGPRADGGLWVSSLLDPILLLAYVITAAMTVRASSAAGILASAGALTAALRLPSLWNLNADWMQGVDDGLKTKALLSAIAAVVIGLGLVVAAVAGRRPADNGAYGYSAVADPAAQPPGRPSHGAAITAFLILGAAGALVAVWEIYWWNERGGEVYQDLFTGERSLVSLLAAPHAWTAWVIAVLALVASIAAVSRATFARPVGMLAGGMLTGFGVFYVSAFLKQELLEHFSDLPTNVQLNFLTQVFCAVAGLVVLIALAQRAQRDQQMMPPPGPPGPYGAPGGQPGPYGAPPPVPPPGW